MSQQALRAPGLRRISRGGRTDYYWSCSGPARLAGYPVRNVPLRTYVSTPARLIEECKRLQREMHIWFKAWKVDNVVMDQPGLGRDRQSYIYFLRAGETVKIGHSAGPLARISLSQTMLPTSVNSVVIVVGTMAEEKRIHRALQPHRIRGEWFSATAEVVKTMLACARFGRVVLE